jgi:phosphonate transport system permease protein
MHTLAWPTRSGRPPLALLAALALLVGVLALTAPLVDVEPARLVGLFTNLPEFLGRFMVLPDWSYLPQLGQKLLETVQIAWIATSIALVVSLPLGIFAAQNATFHPWLGRAARAVLATVRALPEMVWALVFVSALGLGPLPGLLALAAVTVGFMAKFFAESLEVIDPRPVEGVRAAGANALQLRNFAMLPQAMPDFVGTTLYVLDHNVRSATILGLVGAGGIGYDMITSLRLFAYDRLILIIVAIYLLVAALDRLSNVIRRRVI